MLNGFERKNRIQKTRLRVVTLEEAKALARRSRLQSHRPDRWPDDEMSLTLFMPHWHNPEKLDDGNRIR